MARAELSLNEFFGPGSRIMAGYRYSDDNVNGANHSVGGRLRIAFGAAPALSSQTQQWQRMIDPLERNPNIYIGQLEREAVEDGYTEVHFDRVAYSDTDGELTTDIGEGPNTLLVLDGTTPNSETTLQAEQTLAGGGSQLKVQGADSGAVSYASIPGTRPTITNSQISGYALTLGGYNTVNGVNVVSQFPDTGQINNVTLGGIDGSGGLDVMAIVDTIVTVNMAGSGGNGGTGETGEAGIFESTVYGINFADADRVWIENSMASATMTGTGGTGGAGSAGGTASTVSGGGDGIFDGTLYGIDLSGASNAWLTGTTVTAAMTGNGGNGGVGTTSGGGGGGIGVEVSKLFGIALNDVSDVKLTGTTVNAAMTGTGGNSASGIAIGSFQGGGEGVQVGMLYGIDLSGAFDAELSGTTVNATMAGTGGAGGNDGASGVEGDGGLGIRESRLYGISLASAMDITLDNTSVTAMHTGIGGNGGTGFDGGDGGIGIVTASDTYVNMIDLSDASNVWLNDTTVIATMTGTGGNGGTGGIGGDGGVGTTTNGSGAAGIVSSDFYWINPLPVPAGVTLIDPPVLLGDGEESNPGVTPP